MARESGAGIIQVFARKSSLERPACPEHSHARRQKGASPCARTARFRSIVPNSLFAAQASPTPCLKEGHSKPLARRVFTSLMTVYAALSRGTESSPAIGLVSAIAEPADLTTGGRRRPKIVRWTGSRRSMAAVHHCGVADSWRVVAKPARRMKASALTASQIPPASSIVSRSNMSQPDLNLNAEYARPA